MIAWAIPGRLARSARPDPDRIDDWLAEARLMGIRSIVCLLDDDQVARYDGPQGSLLERYRAAGFAVGHVPVKDLQDPPIPAEAMDEVWQFFRDLPGPMLVHCWAGIDRTGAAVGFIRSRLEAEA